MLKTLRLHNFRTFLNAELTFTDRHLVIGKNNSGKTNLCSALAFLGLTARSDLAASAQVVPGGILEIKNWAFKKNQIDLSCTCELPFEDVPHVYTYDLSLTLDAPSTPSQASQVALRVAKERLVVDGPGFKNATLLENDGREAHMLHEGSDEGYEAKTRAPAESTMLSKLHELDTNRRAISFRRYLSSWLYFALAPGAMRFGWSGSPAAPGLLFHRGDNLATVLYHIKNMNERVYRRILGHVQMLEPALEAINFLVSPDQAAVPFVELRGHPRASWHGLSDGTLRCLALATIVEVYGGGANDDSIPPPVVLIEEPENGVYPGFLRRLFDLFEERAPLGQFIFTSHSPYFINMFDGSRESVTLLRRNNERTEVVPVPPAEDDPDRLMLAEQYSMELFD